MPSGHNYHSNKNAALLIGEIINKLSSGDIIKSNDLAKRLNEDDRRYYFTPGRVGQLLWQRTDIESKGKGKWIKL